MLERTFVRPAVHSVVNAMMDDLLALVVNATYSNNTVVTAANFGADDVATLAGDLTTLNVPRSPRSMVIKPAYYAALAKDNAIQASYAFGNPGAIQDNNIPRVRVRRVGILRHLRTREPGRFCLWQGSLDNCSRQPAAGKLGRIVESVQDPDTSITLQFGIGTKEKTALSTSPPR